jgi:hypothetical protein
MDKLPRSSLVEYFSLAAFLGCLRRSLEGTAMAFFFPAQPRALGDPFEAQLRGINRTRRHQMIMLAPFLCIRRRAIMSEAQVGTIVA